MSQWCHSSEIFFSYSLAAFFISFMSSLTSRRISSIASAILFNCIVSIFPFINLSYIIPAHMSSCLLLGACGLQLFSFFNFFLIQYPASRRIVGCLRISDILTVVYFIISWPSYDFGDEISSRLTSANLLVTWPQIQQQLFGPMETGSGLKFHINPYALT